MQLPYRIMQYMSKHLAVAIISHVTGKAPARKKFLYGDKSCIFAVCHGTIALYEKRMTGVKINCIVGVLSSLCENDSGFESVIVKAPKFGHLERVAHLFQCENVRIKGKDEYRLVGLADFP